MSIQSLNLPHFTHCWEWELPFWPWSDAVKKQSFGSICGTSWELLKKASQAYKLLLEFRHLLRLCYPALFECKSHWLLVSQSQYTENSSQPQRVEAPLPMRSSLCFLCWGLCPTCPWAEREMKVFVEALLRAFCYNFYRLMWPILSGCCSNICKLLLESSMYILALQERVFS